MKRLVIITLMGCFLALVAAEAFAWELKLKGVTEYRYRYLTRFGQNDLFGNAGNVPLGINHIKQWQSPDTWTPGYGTGLAGIYAGEPRFGADNNEVAMHATLYPTIKVNKAVKLSGSINLTSLGLHSGGRSYGPLYGGGFANSLWVPINDRMAGSSVPNMMVTTQWWKISVKMPIMDLSIGTKTSGGGMGLWKSKACRASTSFGMKAHYGPLTIAFSPYLGRSDSDWDTSDYRDSTDQNTAYRKNDIRDYFRGLSFGVKYKGGPLEAGIIKDGHITDLAPNVIGRGTTGQPGLGQVGGGNRDRWVHDTIYYVKYANGRFFINAEVDHFWQHETGRSTALNIDQDAFMYGVEGGVLFGPSKLTLSYFRAMGDDISTFENDEDAGRGDTGISACYVKNWAYLMEYRYGTGSGFDAEGYGSPTNMHHVGGKIDYSIAANLNMFLRGVYCWRDAPQAFRLGGDGFYQLAGFSNATLALVQAGQSTALPVPADKDSIGWEIDGGFDWKLLENLTWSMLFAYWQPGEWWSYALPDTAAVLGQTFPTIPTTANYTLAINGGRTIDPLFAVESTLSIHF